MGRILWLPEQLRNAGLAVNEYPGWRERGSVDFEPAGVICHATAGVLTPPGDMRVLWETGSVSAPAPISQLFLARTGVWTVGASGRCNHVLAGRAGSPFEGKGNRYLLGIEAANNNLGEPWPAVQLESYQRGVAAILRHTGWPVDHVLAHREHQIGKSDPVGIDMVAFRAAVARLLEEDPMSAAEVWAYPIASPGLGITARPAGDWLKDARALRQLVERDVLPTLESIRAAIQLIGDDDPDVSAVLAGVDVRLAALRTAMEAEVRDAVADAAEGGAERVRADQP